MNEFKEQFGAQDGNSSQPADYTDQELEELTRKHLEYYQFDDKQFPLPMAQEAFCGTAGEIVTAIAEQSEASPEAILSQFLVGFGNILGRGAHRKQAATHHLNEFSVLVGETSLGRKGTPGTLPKTCSKFLIWTGCQTE